MQKVILFAILATSAITIAWADTCNDTQMVLEDGSCVDTKFSIKTISMDDNTTFAFYISAQGTFYVDWDEGDNMPAETITHNNTTSTLYSHTYTTGGVKIIRLAGVPTRYNGNYNNTIRFGYGSTADNSTPLLISELNGSLGEIFPTLNTPPTFSATFSHAKIKTVPETLFSGIHDSAPYMFNGTFSYSTITTVPANLFSGIHTPVQGLFNGTFLAAASLTTIPPTLFHSIDGPAVAMFQNTFRHTGITSIPPELFQTINGSAYQLFDATFMGCPNLTSIPDNLFSGITNVTNREFGNTFSNNSSLRGYIPPSLFSGLNNSGLDTNNFMQSVFASCPNLAKTCPPGTVQFVTGYESYWDGHVSCVDENMVCPAGQYLPAYGYECTICPQNNYCPGGTYQYSENITSGITQCPNSLLSPSGSSEIGQCGYILHIGDTVLYLRSIQKTTPSLKFKTSSGDIFYANATIANVQLHAGTTHKLHVSDGNTIWSIYDDTVLVDE